MEGIFSVFCGIDVQNGWTEANISIFLVSGPAQLGGVTFGPGTAITGTQRGIVPNSVDNPWRSRTCGLIGVSFVVCVLQALRCSSSLAAWPQASETRKRKNIPMSPGRQAPRRRRPWLCRPHRRVARSCRRIGGTRWAERLGQDDAAPPGGRHPDARFRIDKNRW